jgi:hypothetical protein
VDDLFKALERSRVGEDDRAKLAPIDRPAWLGQDVHAKGPDDRVVDRLARLLEFMSQVVGVDHMCPALAQHCQHGALAAGDVASQADQINTVGWHKLSL